MNAEAFDPGVTTGYAVGDIDDGEMLVLTGQMKWNQLGLWEHLVTTKPDVLIYERFEFRHGKRNVKAPHGLELMSREMIGVIELYAQMNNCKVIKQNPMKGNPKKKIEFGASATTFFDDKRLKEAGIFKSNQDHANDAARHLLYWFKFGHGYQFNTKGYKTGVLV